MKKICLLSLVCLLICCSKKETEPENRPPGDFTVITSVNLDAVTINWTTASDPDGDTVSYSVELNGNNILANSSERTISQNGLDYNTSYSGKVIAKDSEGLCTEKTFSFTTSEEPNNSPISAVLKTPENQLKSVVLLPEFTWEQATDPDGDTVIYDVYLDTSTDPTTLISSEQTPITHTSTTSLELNTTYYWKVVAKDNRGGESTSEIFTFSTNVAPAVPVLVTPEDNTQNLPLKPNLSWNTVSDPDNDVVTYDVILDTNANPSTKIAEGISSTNYTISQNLENETRYYWKIIASDGKEGETESEVRSFVTRGMASATQVVESADFNIRYGHTSVAFNNKMWVIAGIGCCGNSYSDVWSSDDGENWTLVTETAPFGKRWEHASVIFDNKMWVIGGRSAFNDAGLKNDVWYTEDGENWVEATASAQFTPRYISQILSYDNKLFLIGGQDASSTADNEVWSSEDGVTWTLLQDNANFCCRGFKATVFQNKMWYIAGFSKNIYSSTNGITWSLVTAEAEFDVRVLHSTVVFNNRLWLIAGRRENSSRTNDAWYSDDGVNWIQANSNLGFGARSSHTSVVFNNKIWVIAGDNNGTAAYNDVWTIEQN